MNPYLTDRDIVERILAAARRGVKVRVVISQKSNNPQATAALKHHYADLLAAGAEVWELPGTVVHAKIVVADDIVSFGTVNLDAWALYRNSEIMMIAHSREAAALLNERLFEPDIARSNRGEAAFGHARAPRELALRQAHVLPLTGCGRAYVWATTSTTVVSASTTPPTVNSHHQPEAERRLRAALDRPLKITLAAGAHHEQPDRKPGVAGAQHHVGPWSHVEQLGRKPPHRERTGGRGQRCAPPGEPCPLSRHRRALYDVGVRLRHEVI